MMFKLINCNFCNIKLEKMNDVMVCKKCGKWSLIITKELIKTMLDNAKNDKFLIDSRINELEAELKRLESEENYE